VYQEITDNEDEEDFLREETDIFPEEEEMADQLPAWVQLLMENQQTQIDHLSTIIQNNANAPHQHVADTRPLRPEYIYEFSPAESADDTDYYLFTERITDMVATYGQEKILPSLVSCLKNARAKTWYTSLSDTDKDALRNSVDHWKLLLKRDFGIKPYRAKLLLQRETFSFSQNRSVIQYVDKKLACLKIADIVDEDAQCVEIKEGLRDPEFRSLIRLSPQGNTLAWLRQELIDTEQDSRAVWAKNQRPRYPFQQPRYGTPNASANDGTTTTRGRGGYRGRGRGSYPPGQQPPQSPPTQRPPLAITATASKDPPRACRFCGGKHWDRECVYGRQNATAAYHCYQMDMPEEDYEKAEEDYRLLEEEVFAVVAEYEDSNDENYSSYYSPPPRTQPSVPLFPAPPSITLKTSPVAPMETHHNAQSHAFFLNSNKSHTCDICHEKFPSRNQLFSHLTKLNHFLKKRTRVDSNDISIVESSADSKGVGSGYAFRDHNYCEIKYLLELNGKDPEYGCLDTGSGMSLVDESIPALLPWIDRKVLKAPINVKGIGTIPKESWETIVMPVYLPDISGTKLAKLTREFHIVKDLDCGIIFGNDVIEPEGIIIDVRQKKASITSCNNMLC
jgi:hypothetical protein